MLLEELHVLRQLDALGQPLRGLRHCPVVDLGAAPRLPQLADRDVHVVVEVEHPVPVLVARVVLELLPQELQEGGMGLLHSWGGPPVSRGP